MDRKCLKDQGTTLLAINICFRCQSLEMEVAYWYSPEHIGKEERKKSFTLQSSQIDSSNAVPPSIEGLHCGKFVGPFLDLRNHADYRMGFVQLIV